MQPSGSWSIRKLSLTVTVRQIFKAVAPTCKQPNVCRFFNCNTHSCGMYFSPWGKSASTHIFVLATLFLRHSVLNSKRRTRKKSWMWGAGLQVQHSGGWSRSSLSLEPTWFMTEAKGRGQRLPGLWREPECILVI